MKLARNIPSSSEKICFSDSGHCDAQPNRSRDIFIARPIFR
jgi:hypothetical protein